MPQIVSQNSQGNDVFDGAKKVFGFIGDALQELGNTISSAFNEQKFYNVRMKCIDYITNRGGIRTAVVTMHLKKNRSSINLCLDILLTTINGEIKQNKSFYDVDITEYSLIPDYIIEHLKENFKMDMSFDQKDLQTFHDECNVNIVDSITYNDIERICKSKSIGKIKLIDRVFYTRVEYLDSNNEVKGVGHFGKINGLPNDVYAAVYPFNECLLQI